MPLILDKYVIAGFLKYFFLVLCSFAIIFIVFTFFELLEDVVSQPDPDSRRAELLSLLAAANRVLHDSDERAGGGSGELWGTRPDFADRGHESFWHQPVSPCAVSHGRHRVHERSVICLMQEYVLPGCNQKQDALRDKIKGRRPQTYLRPDRKCMMGEQSQDFLLQLL